MIPFFLYRVTHHINKEREMIKITLNNPGGELDSRTVTGTLDTDVKAALLEIIESCESFFPVDVITIEEIE